MNRINILSFFYSRRIRLLLFIGLICSSGFGFAASPNPSPNLKNTLTNSDAQTVNRYVAPSTKFDLRGWKLQIPGPPRYRRYQWICFKTLLS